MFSELSTPPVEKE